MVSSEDVAYRPRVVDIAKLVVAVASYVPFAVGAVGLLGLLVPEPQVTVATPIALLLTAVSGLVIWAVCRSAVRSLTKRAGGSDLNPHSVGHGLTVLAWLPLLWFAPAVAVLGPNGRLATYPGSVVVIAAVSALPAVTALSGWAGATVTTAVGWLTIMGAAFWVPLPWPDVGTIVLAVAGWSTYGVLAYRRSAPERGTREARTRALEAELRLAARRRADERARDERRRWQETVRIPAHKGRKGVSIDVDRRRWVVRSRDVDEEDVEVGRVVLEHRPEPGTSPLPVTVEVRRSRGETASTLRVLTGIEDPGAIGPSEPEVHRSGEFGDVLCALVRVPDGEDPGRQTVRSVLSYAWRARAHASDVRVRASSRDEQRVLGAVEDLDALVAGVRFL